VKRKKGILRYMWYMSAFNLTFDTIILESTVGQGGGKEGAVKKHKYLKYHASIINDRNINKSY
jgi:hypothetical protein